MNAIGSRFPRHLHDEYVICANLSGREEIWLDGKVSDVFAGQVTIYNPSRFNHLCSAMIREFITSTCRRRS
ncbi:AraC family ligand binding domain-containing protein (plasmid) [Pseudomonas silvicola]|nr:AraC family ligand binding domain-containing protein [Pseudomonas silvicola]